MGRVVALEEDVRRIGRAWGWISIEKEILVAGLIVRNGYSDEMGFFT